MSTLMTLQYNAKCITYCRGIASLVTVHFLHNVVSISIIEFQHSNEANWVLFVHNEALSGRFGIVSLPTVYQ